MRAARRKGSKVTPLHEGKGRKRKSPTKKAKIKEVGGKETKRPPRWTKETPEMTGNGMDQNIPFGFGCARVICRDNYWTLCSCVVNSVAVNIVIAQVDTASRTVGMT